KILGGGNEIGFREDARIATLDAELLVNLITANATEIVTLRIEEQTLDEGASIGGSRGVARAQTAINIFESFFLVLGGILLHAFDDDPFVERGIDDFDLIDAKFSDLLDHGL